MSQPFLKKLRRRINDVVTNDETLRLMLNDDIARLKKEIGRISINNNNDIEIIAEFFMLIAHLLGWSHKDGKFYRTPIYYQTDTQREDDLQKSANVKPSSGIYEVYKRRQIVIRLLSEGNSYEAVARIMGLTASNVKALEKGDHIDEWYHEMLARLNKKD